MTTTLAIQTTLTDSILTTRDELNGIGLEWNTLLEESDANTIFLTWEWITSWLDAVYPEAQLCIVIVRDGEGRLVAIAPFYRSDFRFLGTLDYQCLRIIGDCQSGAEYGDIIVRRGFEEAAMAVVTQALMNHRDMWDCIWLTNVAGWTDAYDRVTDMCHQQGLLLHERIREFSRIALPETYGDYLRGLSKNRREQLGRKIRQLERRHDVRALLCERSEDLPGLLAQLFELHRQRWESVGQEGSFVRRPTMKDFYERFAHVALRKGWLRLFALQIDGAIKAVQYGYVYNRIFHQIQEGFDPQQNCGLGNVLRNHVIGACIREGLQEYDFLGGFTEHKRRWGAGRRVGHDLLFGQRSLKNQALFYKQIWPSSWYVQEGRPACDGRSHD